MTRHDHAFDRGDHVELAGALLDRLAPPMELVYAEGSAWRYAQKAGLWTTLDAAESSRIVQGFAGTVVGSGKEARKLRVRAGDVTGTIKLAQDRIAAPRFFEEAPAGLVFDNGFVVVNSDGARIEAHSRDHRARAGYPFAYVPRAFPKRFLTFLAALFRDDDDRIEKETFIQEFFGACILGIAPRYQRCLMAKGDGDNGKSKFADIMLAAMPPGTTSAIPPQQWGQEYRRAMLAGKRLNAVGELPEREILASESFKAIVVGDPIDARVIREAPFTFRPIAGHYFAANRLPGVVDQTEGFWRRFVVVPFNRSFKNDPGRDPQIAESIIACELAEIVSWLIDGAVRLLREKAYTLPPSHGAALANWRRNANVVALFVDAECRELRAGEEVRTDGVPAAELYAAYRAWAELNGHRNLLASNTFGERMSDLGRPSQHTRDGNRYPIAIMTVGERSVKSGERP